MEANQKEEKSEDNSVMKKIGKWFRKKIIEMDPEEEKAPQIKPAPVKKENVKHNWDLIIDEMPAN